MKLLGDNIKKNLKGRFIKAIKDGIKNGEITTYIQAEEVAKIYLKDNYESYDPCLAVANLLNKKISVIHNTHKIKHPYFKVCKYILYTDIWGRMWSKTIGTGLNENVKLTDKSNYDGLYRIGSLGGGMWTSKNKIRFVCEYRTTPEEQVNRIRPETFI